MRRSANGRPGPAGWLAGLVLGLVWCGLLAACSGGGYALQAGDSLEIQLDGQTVKTVDGTSFTMVEGIEAGLVHTTELVEQGTMELYVKGRNKPILFKDPTLEYVTGILDARLVPELDVVTITGHMNPYLSVFMKCDLKTGLTDFFLGSVHAMNRSGEVAAVVIPRNTLDEPEPGSEPEPALVLVGHAEVGRVPADFYDLKVTDQGFAGQGENRGFTLVKQAGTWVLQ